MPLLLLTDDSLSFWPQLDALTMSARRKILNEDIPSPLESPFAHRSYWLKVEEEKVEAVLAPKS